MGSSRLGAVVFAVLVALAAGAVCAAPLNKQGASKALDESSGDDWQYDGQSDNSWQSADESDDSGQSNRTTQSDRNGKRGRGGQAGAGIERGGQSGGLGNNRGGQSGAVGNNRGTSRINPSQTLTRSNEQTKTNEAADKNNNDTNKSGANRSFSYQAAPQTYYPQNFSGRTKQGNQRSQRFLHAERKALGEY